ncbi:MAG: 50S ribosomal protein L21e [Candidatus Thermoplasmatota archaeon]|jgi:large subunit ribosomal protein L21e|nr:50S ribosomal protein L21e [Candidatus Thermoplasmatota archaeon]MCL5988824.1 50S ribosomal protein L21e [Candidatus Thermoplasmatota archaeon]MCW6170809.1 50S ribosomal protein L21e [Thermoplasmatales archaeon]
MVKMSHGPRAGSRKTMTKRKSERGFPPVSRFMKSFNIGDLAAIDIEPSIHAGLPYHGFQGLTGRITDKQGECYILSVRVGGVEKKLLAGPVHLKKIEG